MTGLAGVLAQVTVPPVDYTAILPFLIPLGAVLVLLAASALITRHLRTEYWALAASGVGVAALVSSLVLYREVQVHGPFTAVAGSLDIDGFACLVFVLVSSVLIVAPFVGAGYLRRENVPGPEFYVLALISGAGAMLMGAANDLVFIFLSLEVLSIPLYVLAGLNRRKRSGGEAAMKYFILGAFSSAIFVYGIALVYGATGSTNLVNISAFLARNVLVSNGVLLAGLALLIVGFGFKIAAVPFHMWSPDVYEGSPSAAVAFMAAIAKVGGFAALIRVLVSSFPTFASSWQPILWVIAVASLLLGAVVAVVQRDVRRMLAYSSINHAGFVLLGLQAATTQGVSASLYYLFTYSLLILGSFAVVSVVGGLGDENHDLSAYRGLFRRSPLLAAAFAVLLLAQAGAPFTTGFFAKLYVVEASVDAHSYALAAIAMASAGVAVFFYLRLVFVMAADTASEPLGEPVVGLTGSDGLVAVGAGTGALGAVATPSFSALAIGCCALASLVFGIWPQPIVGFAHAASLLFT